MLLLTVQKNFQTKLKNEANIIINVNDTDDGTNYFIL